MGNNWKGTKGGWRFDDSDFKIKGVVDTEYHTVIANLSPKMDYSRGKTTQYQNALLIVDAGNTIQDAG